MLEASILHTWRFRFWSTLCICKRVFYIWVRLGEPPAFLATVHGMVAPSHSIMLVLKQTTTTLSIFIQCGARGCCPILLTAYQKIHNIYFKKNVYIIKYIYM